MGSRILLVPNIPYWAVDKNARDLVKYNPGSFDLEIVYFRDFLSNWQKLNNDFDLVFPMYFKLFILSLDAGITEGKMITGIRSFTLWDSGLTIPPGYNAAPPEKMIKIMKKALLLNTHCQKLWYVFSKYLPIIHTKYTCDLDVFFPEKKINKTKFTVGWTGSLKNHGDIRGVFDIIKPACGAVEGVELKIQSAEDKWIKDDNVMREFYNSLDLYICASKSEGTPRPLLEAAACGVPCLTTDVGIAPELVDEGKNGFIVRRSLEDFIAKLNYIKENRDMLSEMGEYARKKMESEFDWKILIHQWMDFFKFSLELKKLKEQGFTD